MFYCNTTLKELSKREHLMSFYVIVVILVDLLPFNFLHDVQYFREEYSVLVEFQLGHCATVRLLNFDVFSVLLLLMSFITSKKASSLLINSPSPSYLFPLRCVYHQTMQIHFIGVTRGFSSH